MKPKDLKTLLLREINSLDRSKYAKCPGIDFTRSRKLPFNTLVETMLRMEGKSMGNELISAFPKASETPSVSAFFQQRSKLKAGVFDDLFHSLVLSVESIQSPKTFNGLRLLAVDGTDIHIPTDRTHTETLLSLKQGTQTYNMMHMNAIYDLLQHTYVDEVIQNYNEMNEHKAFIEMVDRSWLDNVLVMADRGYESFNNMAHAAEKGWYFLFRARESHGIADGLDLPAAGSFDVPIDLRLTRKQTKEAKALFADRNHYHYLSHVAKLDYLPACSRKSDPLIWYNISFRIVRFPITEDSYETILTNLPEDIYPTSEIKRLYSLRWGIETSFRSLKYTVGLLYFHSKKAEYIRHEIVARLIMYNFSEMITAHVIIHKKDRKYDCKINFAVAVHVCRLFLRGDISPPDLEAQLSRNIVPIRPDRKRKREKHSCSVISFTYRLA
jgi:IS4 transposase